MVFVDKIRSIEKGKRMVRETTKYRGTEISIFSEVSSFVSYFVSDKSLTIRFK